jgi:hypothetical protein
MVRKTITAVIVMACGGCATETPDLPTAAVADSAGVRILTYDLTDVTPPTYRVLGPPDLEIGVVDGPPAYTFSRIHDLAVTQDGSLVVSDRSTPELRVYDATGMYLRTVGGRGDGPGEFASSPAVAGLVGDTLFAHDPMASRVTTFTLDGSLVDAMTLPVGSAGRAALALRMDDGTYLVQTTWIAPNSADELHDFRLELDSIVIERTDAVGAPRDTVAVMPSYHRVRRVSQRGDGVFGVTQADAPFSPRPFILTDGARAIFAHSDRFELRLWDSDVDQDLVVRVLGVDHPATADEIRTYHEAAIRAAAAPDEVDPLVWRLNIESLPDRLPSFRQVRVSDAGEIWVSLMDFDDSEGWDWLVFSPTGELRGLVHSPPRTELHAVGRDFVIGVTLDELDVPFVRRYPLVDPG